LTVEHVTDTETHAVLSIDGTAVAIWKQPPVMAAVDDLRRLFALLRGSDGAGRFGYLALIEARAGVNVRTDVRDALAGALREYQAAISASVIVFEGTGFRASIVRSVVDAIFTSAPLAFPSTVESDLSAGARWLVERLGSHATLTPAQLANAVNELRRRWNHEARA
jgi:hypothetical protein